MARGRYTWGPDQDLFCLAQPTDYSNLLSTKLDELQWEVNRLEAENLKLWEVNPGVVQRIDGEVEWDTKRREAAKLTEGQLELRAQEITDAAAAGPLKMRSPKGILHQPTC